MNDDRVRGRDRRAGEGSLDPDHLARLEHDRDYLLRSLDDLDAEHDAGDLDDHDHRELTDDYTRRLADVIRSIDRSRDAMASVGSRLSMSRRVVTVAGVALVALVAGVLLARSAGFRAPSDSVSGDIRQSSTALLAEADTLTREGRTAEAIEVYDAVLAVAPANVEALTYRGWLTARLGDPQAGLADVSEAIAVDPSFPDARVFAAILLDDEQRFDEAAEQLAALDALDAPDQITALVDGSDLRASVAAGQIAERFGDGTPIDLELVNAPLDDIAQAGLLLDGLDPVLSVRVLGAVLEADPTNLVALVGKGRQLGVRPAVFEQSPEVAAQGLELLDRAVELAPDSGEVRLYRAQARWVQQDPTGARADLEAIDPAELPEGARDLYAQLLAALDAALDD